MTPRRDRDYFSLKTEAEKIAYVRGMPRKFISLDPPDMAFVNYRTSPEKMISAAEQKKTYDLLSAASGSPHTAIFASQTNDAPALMACCAPLVQRAAKSFASFQFVNVFEDLPKTTEDVQDLYVVMGVHEDDLFAIHRLRRWIRTAHGATVWAPIVAKDPYAWVDLKLGIIPDFLFLLKRPTRSVG